MDIVHNNVDIDDVYFASELSQEDLNNNNYNNVERSNLKTPPNMNVPTNIEYDHDKITPEEHFIQNYAMF